MTRRSRRTRQLQVEQLEHRQLMAVVTMSDWSIYDDSLPCISAEEIRQQQAAADQHWNELRAAIPESLQYRVSVFLMDSFDRIQDELDRPGSTGESVERVLQTGPYAYGWQRVSAAGELLVSVQFDSRLSEADIAAKIATIQELGLRAEPGDSYSPVSIWVRPDQLELMAQIPGAVSFQAWQSMMITHVYYPPVPTRAPCEPAFPPRDLNITLPPQLIPVSPAPGITHPHPLPEPLPSVPTQSPPIAPVEPIAEVTPPSVPPSEPLVVEQTSAPDAVQQLVGIRLALTDLAGNSIDTVTVGEAFRLSVYVDDLREAGAGVFASFVNIDFDTTLVAPSGTVQYPATHMSRGKCERDENGIRGAGGVLGMSYTNGDEQLLFTTAFTAETAGDLLFSSSHSAGIDLETLLFGLGFGIDAASITYGQAALRIKAAN